MNNVVLITGASTGFGRTAAEALAQRGYRVIATMRDTSGRNASTVALRSLAKREGWSLGILDMDVTDDASVRQARYRVSEAAEWQQLALFRTAVHLPASQLNVRTPPLRLRDPAFRAHCSRRRTRF